MSADDRALDEHARRLERLEDFQLTFGPLVARIDERLAGIQTDVGELKVGLGEVRKSMAHAEEQNHTRDAEVKALAESSRDRRANARQLLIWIGGIAASVIGAIILFKLRLGK